MSNDGTYEVIEFYKNHGVHGYREEDYKQKGNIMTKLIQSEQNYDIAFPLDIDEFIVYYNKEEKCINPLRTRKYLYNLIKSDLFDKNTVFKANYIQTIIDSDDYNNPINNTYYGVYLDYQGHAKTFLNKKKWDGILDHGNHYPTTEYIMSDLCLVHYHCRNKNQMIKKVETNIIGLGYPINDVDYLKSLPKDCPGSHHVKHMISILEDDFTIPVYDSLTASNHVSLEPLINIAKTFNIIP